MIASDPISVLSRCAGQLYRICKARACFAYLVQDSAVSFRCEESSLVEHMAEGLPEELKKEVCQLQGTIKELEFTNRSDSIIYQNQENSYGLLLNGEYINNLRIVPICDAHMTFAICVLVNVASDKLSTDRLSLKPFISATANIFNIKQIRNFLPEHRQSLENVSKSGVLDVLSHVYHPVILFNQLFVITKYNEQSMLMIQQSSMEETYSIDELLKYFAPLVRIEIMEQVKTYLKTGSFTKIKWRDVPLKLNSFQSIDVDIGLIAVNANKGFNKYQHKESNHYEKGTHSEVDFALMINDKKRKELHSLQRFQALTSLIPLGILQLSTKFECLYANDMWSSISSHTLTSSLKDGWSTCFSSNDLHRVLPRMNALNIRNREFTEELQITTFNKQKKWVVIKSTGLFDDLGVIEGYLLTVDDISQTKARNSELENLANTDSLTGLSNRACFHDRLKLTISRVARHGNAAILYIDLDKFKSVNDTYGHNVGDGVIQKVAHRLRRLIRKEDTVARLGGDEFALIVSDVKSRENVASLASKIIIELTRPMQIETITIKTQCSIGIEHLENSNVSLKSVLRHADLAVYKAKSMGRNQFCVYTPSLEKHSLLANFLRASLNQDGFITDFFTEYQPQVNAQTNEIIGIEALSRWKHPRNESVSPQDFIVQLEINGLINEFFVWQLSSILPLAQKWIRAGLISIERRLSINLSAVQLHVASLSKDILLTFDKYNLSPEFFGFEVTETAFMEDPIGAGENLKVLREAGFHVALDDFGTGYSSLSLLRKMPLDGIKIDKEFVAEIMSNPTDAKIVQSMITLSQQLNLDVVAEGVESEDVKVWLSRNHCENQQGFHFYRPMSPNKLEECLTQVISFN